ncbi:retrotransposon protein, putative, ty1-copia subclass [Tanacetum coccineum]
MGSSEGPLNTSQPLQGEASLSGPAVQQLWTLYPGKQTTNLKLENHLEYDKVVQDQRQRDDTDLQVERQDQPKEEEVEPRRSKRARTEKSFGPDLFLLWKADGTVDKYKARLLIKGFRQRKGLDYFDTYSLVTRITSIRMILAIAALINLEVHQIDVKKAFLKGDLEDEIYMNQPGGFMAPELENRVCRLVKSLYDLRKAPKQGHQISPYHITSEGNIKSIESFGWQCWRLGSFGLQVTGEKWTDMEAYDVEVGEDVARIREYKGIVFGLRIAMRRRKECIDELKALGDCEGAA